MSFLASGLGNLLARYAAQRFPQFGGTPPTMTTGYEAQGIAGTPNASYGQAQGAYGAPYGDLGALLGGNPATSQRMDLPTTKMAPEQPAPLQPAAPQQQTATIPGVPQPQVPAAPAPPTTAKIMAMLTRMANGGAYESKGLFGDE